MVFKKCGDLGSVGAVCFVDHGLSSLERQVARNVVLLTIKARSGNRPGVEFPVLLLDDAICCHVSSLALVGMPDDESGAKFTAHNRAGGGGLSANGIRRWETNGVSRIGVSLSYHPEAIGVQIILQRFLKFRPHITAAQIDPWSKPSRKVRARAGQREAKYPIVQPRPEEINHHHPAPT